jgi:hypothetical protein
MPLNVFMIVSSVLLSKLIRRFVLSQDLRLTNKYFLDKDLKIRQPTKTFSHVKYREY